VLWTFVPLALRANPVVIDPSSMLGFGVVAFSAMVVEAWIVALPLTFSGLAPLRIFGGFFLTNLLVFSLVFYPLLERIPLPVSEMIVVLADDVAIKLLAHGWSFQQDEFGHLSWSRATAIAVVGNASSFFVGLMATRRPWEEHGTYE
jgi:hypothetical protein